MKSLALKVIPPVLLSVFVLTACANDTNKQRLLDTEALETRPVLIESTCGGDTGRWIPLHAENSKGYANMSLTVIDGWECENVELLDTDGECFGISFWPEGQNTGRISVLFYEKRPVIKCGTGITCEEITLGEYTAYMDTYYESALWSDIWLTGTPGCYVIKNMGAEVWYDEYKDEAMEILESLKVGKGILSEKTAIEFAERRYADEYDKVRAEFDYITGIWQVTFNEEPKQITVEIGSDGIIKDVTENASQGE